MRVLVISFYYKPDLCAGSFRTTSFVDVLKKHMTKDDVIEVITTFPNRYSSFHAEASGFEDDNGVTVKRIKIPSHRSGFLDQARSFLFYFVGSLWYIRNRKYDVVFATSSRLFTAFLGAVIARKKRIPLYLDIRDIFVDTLKSVLKNSSGKALLPLFKLVENYTIKSATKVNLVSRGFLPYFEKKYHKEYSFFSNGIDDVFLDQDFSKINQNEKMIFTYTGNIGEGQGLEKIIPKIAEKYKNILFYIIGDGGRRCLLEKYVLHLKNVRLVKPVSREALVEFYRRSDVLFLHLNDYEAFKKVLPSKIFEYAATYKPIIAGVDGYARKFIAEHLPDSLIFDPCDFNDFCVKYEKFNNKVDIDKRECFVKKFTRRKIMKDLSADLLKLMMGPC